MQKHRSFPWLLGTSLALVATNFGACTTTDENEGSDKGEGIPDPLSAKAPVDSPAVSKPDDTQPAPAVIVPASDIIRLRHAEIRQAQGIIDPSTETYAQQQSAKKQNSLHLLVRRADVPAAERWDDWKKLGISQEYYLGQNTWLVRVDLSRAGAKPVATVAKELGATHVSPYLPEHKASITHRAGKFSASLYDAGRDEAKVVVTFHPSTPKATIDELVRTAHKGSAPAKRLADHIWALEIASGALQGLLEREEVHVVDEGPQPHLPLMDLVRRNTGAEQVQQINTTPKPPTYGGWTGKGVRMANSEGIDPNHDDYWNHNWTGARTTKRWIGCEGTGNAHGTMTAGIMLGNGWQSSLKGGTPYQWRGMAPEAIFDCPQNLPDISNSSFTGGFGPYSYDEEAVDADVKAGYIRVGSAANQGITAQYGTEVGYYSLYRASKNEIIVGNFDDYDFRWNWGSLGPTWDGRIKPDLAAFGEGNVFPRDAGGDINFEVDEFQVQAASGTRTWSFNATNPGWHGGWAQDPWWGSTNIGPIVQFGITGGNAAMRVPLKHPPFGGWSGRPRIGVFTEPGGGPALAINGSAGDKITIRYRLPVMPEWTGSRPEFWWSNNYQSYIFNKMPISIIADGDWHTTTINVGTHAGWAGINGINGMLIHFEKRQNLVTALGGNSYGGSSGTSAASPVVAGAAALLLDQMKVRLGAQLGQHTTNSPFWYGGPSSGSPLPSTIKALLVQTARDLAYTPTLSEPNNPDTGATTVYHKGPDLASGYGLIDVAEAVRLVEGHITAKLNNPSALYHHIVERLFSTTALHSYVIPVAAGRRLPLKVTLAWDDAPGSTTSANNVSKLVNNLDLRLRSPSGVFYYPWSIDQPWGGDAGTVEPEPITAAAIKPARQDLPNNLDNLEQVLVEFPEAGNWTVDVISTSLAAPPQKYSLVLDTPVPAAPNLTQGKVAFVSDRVGSKHQVYVTNVGSGTVTKLTNETSSARYPIWSPNGQFLAYIGQDTFAGTSDALRIMNSAGTIVASYSAPNELGVTFAKYPEWSPDGKRILLTAFSNWGVRSLAVMTMPTAYDWANATFSTVVPFPSGPGALNPGESTFAPDSSTIYFTSDASLYRVGVNGGTPYQIYGDAQPLRHVYAPSMAPNGQQIIFNSEMWLEDPVKYRNEEIVGVNVLTGIAERLTWQNGNQLGRFATNAKAGEFVLHSNTTMSGKRDIFVQQNGVQTKLSIVDTSNIYDDFEPRWWKP